MIFKYLHHNIIQLYIHHLRAYSQPTSWPTPSWCDSSTDRALQWNCRGQGSNPYSGLYFSGSTCYCLRSTIKTARIVKICLATEGLLLQPVRVPRQHWQSSYWISVKHLSKIYFQEIIPAQSGSCVAFLLTFYQYKAFSYLAAQVDIVPLNEQSGDDFVWTIPLNWI